MDVNLIFFHMQKLLLSEYSVSSIEAVLVCTGLEQLILHKIEIFSAQNKECHFCYSLILRIILLSCLISVGSCADQISIVC